MAGLQQFAGNDPFTYVPKQGARVASCGIIGDEIRDERQANKAGGGRVVIVREITISIDDRNAHWSNLTADQLSVTASVEIGDVGYAIESIAFVGSGSATLRCTRQAALSRTRDNYDPKR